MLEFELRPEHIALLRAAYVRWEDCEYGAPAIDCKRPYGNSDVEADIARILGWGSLDERSTDEAQALTDEAERLHRETETALQVILATGSFEPGTYQRSEGWMKDWRRVEPTGEGE